MSARKRQAAFGDDRVVAIRKPRDEIVRIGDFRCRDDLLIGTGWRAEDNILPDCASEKKRVLQDHADLASQRTHQTPLDVLSVDENRPLGRIVEPWNEGDERALAGAGCPNNGKGFSGIDRQVNGFERAPSVPIVKAHIAKLDLAFRHTQRHGAPGVIDLAAGLQNVDDPLQTDDCFGRRIGGLGEGPHRAIEIGYIGKENDHVTGRQLTGKHPCGTKPHDEAQTGRRQKIDHGCHRGLIIHAFEIGLQTDRALTCKAAVLPVFLGESLHDADGRQRFLGERCQLPGAAARLPGRALHMLGVSRDAPIEDRRNRQGNQGKLPIQPKHHCQHAGKQEGIGHQSYGTAGDCILHRLHVRCQTGDQIARLLLVVKAQRQPLHVRKQAGAQVIDIMLRDAAQGP